MNDCVPFFSKLLTICDPNGAVWLLWQCVTDPPEYYEWFELTASREETP